MRLCKPILYSLVLSVAASSSMVNLLKKAAQALGQPSSTPYRQQQQHPQLPSGPVGRVENEVRVLHAAGGTYPRLSRLSDGTVLCAFTRFEGGQHVLSIARSVDGGESFAPWGEVTRSPGDCDNPFLIEVPRQQQHDQPLQYQPGDAPPLPPPLPTVLVAFRNHDLAPDGRPVHFRITVCRSSDGGRSWAFCSQAAEKPAPWGLWEPFMRVGRGGAEIQLYFSQELAHDDQDTMTVASTDGGRTWTAPRCVTGAGERLRDGMVGIASTMDTGDDGSYREVLIMVFETTRYGGAFSVEAVLSYDEGATWVGRHEVYRPRSRGTSAGAPQIESFADGSLAVVFMTDEDVPEGQRAWPGRAAIKAVFAVAPRSGRISWHPSQTVHEPSCAWPGILRVDDFASLAAFEHGGGVRGRVLAWG